MENARVIQHEGDVTKKKNIKKLYWYNIMDTKKKVDGTLFTLTELLTHSFNLTFQKLQNINKFLTDSLTRILNCVDSINERVQEITVILLRMEGKI